MKVNIKKIKGVKTFKVDFFEDQRGFFFEAYKKKNYFKVNFLQDNISLSKKNVLRGLHYQIKKTQGHLITIIRGKIFDVVVDLRKSSPTFKDYASYELSEKGNRQIFLPPGCAHGFQVLSKEALILYKCTNFYSPKDERGILWSDPFLKIDWPNNNPVVNEKDLKYPLLSDILKNGDFFE